MNPWDLVSEAYIYAFPLVITNATRLFSTNTEAATSSRAPINQLSHAQKLADAKFRTVVTPNVDTVYSQAWLDLEKEPLLYTMPEADRFFTLQVLDAWTNTVTVLQTAGIYAFTLPGWQGTLPEGVIRVDIPTATAWLIARIVLSGQEDFPNVAAIQQEMSLLPLSAYLQGGVYTPPTGTVLAEHEFVPVGKVLAMSPKVFFDTANALMLSNPPAAADDALLQRLSEIKVGPGMEFDMGILTGDITAEWKDMLRHVKEELIADSMHYATQLGQWLYYGAPIGDFGTAYRYRAMIALCGLGANTVDVAIYPKTEVDASGAPLTGSSTYKMHFETLPPTLDGGFWSVTAYGSDDFLIDNPIDRYCINDRTPFTRNEDGSLDLLLCREKPEHTSNWLPVSEDVFHLYMRIYVPDMAALSNWKPPVIQRL